MTLQSRRISVPLSGWYVIGVFWAAHVALMAALILFRAITHAGIAATFQFDDVPPLRYLQNHFGDVYWVTAASGAILAPVWLFLIQQAIVSVRLKRLNDAHQTEPSPWYTVLCATFALLFTVFGLLARWFVQNEDGASFLFDPESQIAPTSAFDWLAIAWLATATALLPPTIRRTSDRILLPDVENAISAVSVARSSRIIRTGMAYLLGCAAFFIYAWREHVKFWNPEANGGYIYKQFFLEHELPQAHLVLYSTSVLFASLAAVGGCIVLHLIRRAIDADSQNALMKPAGENTRLAFMLAGAWAITLMVPWQIKILPEIRAENGWIFPAVTLLFTVAALSPLMYATQLMLLRDFGELAAENLRTAEVDEFAEIHPSIPAFIPRRTEFALLNFVLFPLYPFIRGLRWVNAWVTYAILLVVGIPLASGWIRLFVSTGEVFTLQGSREIVDSPYFALVVFSIGAVAAATVFQYRRRLSNAGSLYTVMLLMGAAAVAGLTWFVNAADTQFTFDDWRGMMKTAQFPFARVVLSLLAAYFVFLMGRRLVKLMSRGIGLLLPPRDEGSTDWLRLIARPVVVSLSLASLGLATWPFWGWQHVNKNVFARTVEFNHRHEFELRFLHWIFDADRDGYSAVLHGADPDDFNATVHAGGIAPPNDDNPVPISTYAIADAEKARQFPNVAIFFLEGVVPRSISAYGEREIIGTPHMDSIAREGTVFTQARCHYPSTWDGWFAVCSGRYLRIKEMDTSVGFGNRYTRYNNLYKALQLAGVNRWCHADTEPFYDMLVPHSMRKSSATAWKTNFDSSVKTEEDKRGIWRGDHRSQRMVDFIDSLKPNEKFFICEHMSDTHFPWRTTPIEQARKLGFPNGLEPYDADAVLPSGRRDLKYSRYFQTITRMDGQIGRVLNKLKEKGLYDNTMIIVVSDHGCQWWEHEHLYYVSHLYEQSLRIPMIIRYPGISGGGRFAAEPVMQTDILPTIVELAGLKLTNPSKEYPFTCRSLVPLLKGTTTEKQRKEYWERDIILTTHYDKLGVLSQFHHKLIFDRPTGTYRLFDLKEDPGEKKNLADDRPELLAEMLEKFRVLMRKHGAIIGGIRKAKDHDKYKPVK